MNGRFSYHTNKGQCQHSPNNQKLLVMQHHFEFLNIVTQKIVTQYFTRSAAWWPRQWRKLDSPQGFFRHQAQVSLSNSQRNPLNLANLEDHFHAIHTPSLHWKENETTLNHSVWHNFRKPGKWVASTAGPCLLVLYSLASAVCLTCKGLFLSR